MCVLSKDCVIKIIWENSAGCWRSQTNIFKLWKCNFKHSRWWIKIHEIQKQKQHEVPFFNCLYYLAGFASYLYELLSDLIKFNLHKFKRKFHFASEKFRVFRKQNASQYIFWSVEATSVYRLRVHNIFLHSKWRVYNFTVEALVVFHIVLK